MAEVINAVAGVIIKDDKVLLTSRPIGKIYSGSWEFPGGKLESNESGVKALIRELKEEVDIIVLPENCKKFISIVHEYPHAIVKLDVILIEDWLNNIYPLESQQIYWHDFKTPCKLEPLLPTTEKILNLLSSL